MFRDKRLPMHVGEKTHAYKGHNAPNLLYVDTTEQQTSEYSSSTIYIIIVKTSRRSTIVTRKDSHQRICSLLLVTVFI